jgi:peptidoglycan/LPS O-acetylase OafA/YrhL
MLTDTVELGQSWPSGPGLFPLVRVIMKYVEANSHLTDTVVDDKGADLEKDGLTMPLVSAMAKSSKAGKESHIAHLNGLRAMAFIGVFLFHFRYGCQGGFLGVDVFFVLSGYLMTRSIANQISSGTYTYWSFLARRFWRLYPALLVTIIASMHLTYGFFSNEHALQAAKSGLASIFGVSNFLFLSEEGYFNTESAFKPLLHTWSLSAEWQFYLIWPVFMALGTRLAPKMPAFWPLVVLCIVSIVHSVLLAMKIPMAAFFMLSPRAFEFGMGALASLPSVPRVTSHKVGNAMCITGSALIALSFQYINSTHGAPAVIAMPSLIGAIMVILSPSDVIANRIFTSYLFDYFGKISYSAYLVHWPAFVFYHNIFEHAPPVPFYVAAVVVTGTLVLSAILFHAIEDEYRIPRTRRHVAVGLGLLVIAIAESASGIMSQGWSTRRSSRAFPARRSSYYRQEYTELLLPTRQTLPGSNRTALFGAIPVSNEKGITAGDIIDAVVVGDSFCAPLAGVFDSIARQDNKTFLMMTHHSCAPFFDTLALDATKVDGPKRARFTLCKSELRPDMLALIRSAHSKVVVLSFNIFGVREMWRAVGDRKSPKKSQLEETIEILINMGRKVIVMGLVPAPHFDVRACLAASGPLSRFKRCPDVTRFKAPFMGTTEMQNKAVRMAGMRDMVKVIFRRPGMAKARAENKIMLIDPYDAMCNEQTGECVTSHNGEPYYTDLNHITSNASMLFKPLIRKALQQLSH